MVDLRTVIGENEKIIWEGKPDKKCFILESIFNPLLPFALLWGCIDIFVLGQIGFNEAAGFVIPFMLLHMMPVWMYLGGIILSLRKYRNTYYIITDVGLYVSGGAFSYSYDMRPWAELSDISLHRGIFDQQLGVGDVICACNSEHIVNGKTYTSSMSVLNIREYQEVFKLVKQLQRDIHADTMFPNDLRPKENHGYNTEYKK